MKGLMEDFGFTDEPKPGFGPKQALTTAIAAIFYSQWPNGGQLSAFQGAETFIALAEERYGEIPVP